MKTKVAILIPCYNEENTISEVADGIRRSGFPYLIVNDGSLDSTAKMLKINNFNHISYYPNQGKGYAIKTGAQELIDKGYEYIIVMDADGQHSIEDIESFLDRSYKYLEAKIIIGNRFDTITYKGNMPIIRYWVNKFMSWLISKKIGQYIPDSQCGFRLYHQDIFKIPTISDNFEYESEILLKAKLHDFTIENVPIQCIYKKGRESKMNPLRDTIRFFKMIKKY